MADPGSEQGLVRLQQLLDENRRFLQASCLSYDQGFEAEAKRIAVVLRVLLHDTNQSASLLSQLLVKDKLAFFDSAEGIAPQNILSTPGLVVLYSPTGQEHEAKYYAPLDELPPFRTVKRSPFDPWWTSPVTMESSGATWSRKNYVLALANKEGGAHVDPRLDGDYDRLVRQNGLRIEFHTKTGRDVTPPESNVALASVRQVAHEVHKTLARPAYVYPKSF